MQYAHVIANETPIKPTQVIFRQFSENIQNIYLMTLFCVWVLVEIRENNLI